MTAGPAPRPIAIDGRRAPRVKVFSVAAIRSGGAGNRCHILNISLGGALIDCRVEIGSARVLLTAPNFERKGVVKWVRGSKIGVSFDDPLTDDELTSGF
ncbi:PilZ domain-containing protein [Sphingomonas adhaesiva]|uniref:PilZ domain-containing protein n=1 Tax=Sphingomonas adhaesiva TaxID=28212 RepID=UPI002FFA778F